MAGKFRYRLGRILSLREKKEDRVKRSKAAAERERDRERDALDELRARFTAAKRAIGSSLSQGQTANVQMGNEYAAALEKKIADQQKKLEAAESRVSDMEKELQKASIEVWQLEKHSERHKTVWQAEENRKEAIWLGEMATQGYLKRQRAQRADEIEDAEREAALDAADESMSQSAWIAGLMQSAEIEQERRKRDV